jgi:hypothetical protein
MVMEEPAVKYLRMTLPGTFTCFTSQGKNGVKDSHHRTQLIGCINCLRVVGQTEVTCTAALS